MTQHIKAVLTVEQGADLRALGPEIRHSGDVIGVKSSVTTDGKLKFSFDLPGDIGKTEFQVSDGHQIALIAIKVGKSATVIEAIYFEQEGAPKKLEPKMCCNCNGWVVCGNWCGCGIVH